MRVSCYSSGKNIAPTSTTAGTTTTDTIVNSTVRNNQISTSEMDDGILCKNNFGHLNQAKIHRGDKRGIVVLFFT